MRAAIAFTLLLAACNQEPLTQEQHDAVTDIADASIHDSRKVRELEDRIEALEDRLRRAGISE